jgi:hypothetical protein
MKTAVVGAVFAVLAAFGCSGCGSVQHTTTQSRSTTVPVSPVRLALPPAANLVIVPPVSGTGDERFGTFMASGTVYLEFSCKGKGPLTFVGILKHISPCDGSATGASVPYDPGNPVHLTVQAPPGTTWRLAVGEHVPGAALVLVHSSGAGNKSFGTFPLRGTIRAVVACKGKGNLELRFDPPSEATTDFGTVCPEGSGGWSSPPLPAGKIRTARIYVDADPKARWTISVTETSAP